MNYLYLLHQLAQEDMVISFCKLTFSVTVGVHFSLWNPLPAGVYETESLEAFVNLLHIALGNLLPMYFSLMETNCCCLKAAYSVLSRQL